jgi:hypothetical protein
MDKSNTNKDNFNGLVDTYGIFPSEAFNTESKGDNQEDDIEDQQWPAKVTYDSKNFVKSDKSTYPVNGSVCRDKDGTLKLLWLPSEECPCCPIDEGGFSYAYLYEDWYRIPTVEEIRQMITGEELCYVPCDEDEVEPDHPDSWLSLLKII